MPCKLLLSEGLYVGMLPHTEGGGLLNPTAGHAPHPSPCNSLSLYLIVVRNGASTVSNHACTCGVMNDQADLLAAGGMP